jgi:hypothetical protein
LPMAPIDELRARYAPVWNDLEHGWLGDEIMHEVMEWASGPIAMQYFGRGADALDALCLMAAWERAMSTALWYQIVAARSEGRSWNQVAVALGVSRQAAMKRFGGGQD